MTKNIFLYVALTLLVIQLSVAIKEDPVKVAYHVWFDPDSVGTDPTLPAAKNHIVNIENGSTFYAVMERAADERPGEYSFEYIQYPFGKFITSIGGVAQDDAAQIYWMIYQLNDTQTPDPSRPPGDDQQTDFGVDGLLVGPDDVYLFWRKGTSTTKHGMNHRI